MRQSDTIDCCVFDADHTRCFSGPTKLIPWWSYQQHFSRAALGVFSSLDSSLETDSRMNKVCAMQRMRCASIV